MDRARLCPHKQQRASRPHLQALGIPADEGYPGPLNACSPGRFEPDSGAAADHNHGLPEEFRLALTG
jgi:hypothetical protein